MRTCILPVFPNKYYLARKVDIIHSSSCNCSNEASICDIYSLIHITFVYVEGARNVIMRRKF